MGQSKVDIHGAGERVRCGVSAPKQGKEGLHARGKPVVGVKAHEGGSVHTWGGSVCVSESEHDDQGILVWRYQSLNREESIRKRGGVEVSIGNWSDK